MLGQPVQVALDAAGDLYIDDTANSSVREIAAANGTQWGQSMTAGDIYNVAGTPGSVGSSGNGGPATSAQLDGESGIGTDVAGDLFISDAGDNLLQEVPATATSPVPAAAGQISSLYPAPGGITITQPGGAQITFYAQSGGTCTAPYQTAGSFCALPAFTGATLSYNASTQIYTFSPAPGTTSYTYSWTGQLLSETDTAGNSLTVTYLSPSPGSGGCPSSAHSCETITAASGRALIIGSNSAGLVTSVTDPMGRAWTYGYNSASQLTSATDPLTHETSYTYGQGSTGNPLLASDLLTMTGPNAQPGGPDAGDATVNVYDTLGRVTSQTDPMGFTTTFNYTGFNPATGTGTIVITDPDGNKTVDDYTDGTLAADSKWTGSTLTSEQDYGPNTTAGGTSGGTLLDAWTTDGDGNATSYAYNAAGDQTALTEPGPDGLGTISNSYTSQSQANCAANAEAGSSAACTQNAGPAPVSPGGTVTPPSSAPPEGLTYTLYDTNGNELYSTVGAYGPGASSAAYLRTTYQLFNGNTVTLGGSIVSCTSKAPSPSLPCATINADGVVTQLTYDSAGDLTASATPDGNGAENAVTSYSYDSDGEQTSTTSPDGNLPGANASNYATTTAYNVDSQKTATTQAGGNGATVTARTTSYGYDADGNQATQKDARGFITTTTYNAADKATLVTDPDRNATLTCYDGDGNTAQTVPPSGVAAGGLTPASCPSAYPSGYGDRLASDATAYTYDADGGKIADTTPAPAGQTGYETTTYSYDGARDLTKVTAPPASSNDQAQVTVYTYASPGLFAAQTTGYGTSTAATTTFCYDPNGDKTSVVAADGNSSGTAACQATYPWAVSAGNNPTQAAYQTTYSYDSMGELAATSTPGTSAAPNGATTRDTYDPTGNKATSTDPGGITTTWTYTPANLVASISYSSSSAHSATYSYDASGHRMGMTDATGTWSYVDDPFGELTSVQDGSGQTVGYNYDPDGNNTSISYPLPSTATWASGDSVSYGYDNADRLASATDFTGNKLSINDTPDGLPTSTSLASTGDTLTNSYDNTDSAASITLKNSSSTLQSYAYSDAPAGNIRTESDTPASSAFPASYAYDAQSRVTSMTPGSGAQDSYSYDASSSLTTLPGGAGGIYDHAGELVTGMTSPATTNYTYNADGQRLAATQSGNSIASASWNGAGQLASYSASAADMTSATYDGDGLRAASTTEPAGGSATSNSYVWNKVADAPQLLMDSANAYVYTVSGTPAEQVNLATGSVTYLVADSLGSVRGTVNGSGTVTATASYDAWGNPETAGGRTPTTPFGYAGGYTDLTGLVYLVHRYYDPVTGQFISLDPAVMQTGQPYGYANGDPVSATDPSGLSAVGCTGWGGQVIELSHLSLRIPKGIMCGHIQGNGTWVTAVQGEFQAAGTVSEWQFLYRFRDIHENLYYQIWGKLHNQANMAGYDDAHYLNRNMRQGYYWCSFWVEWQSARLGLIMENIM